MKLVVNELAKEKMSEKDLNDQHITITYCGFG